MSDYKYRTPQEILRDFARNANNAAFHLEEEVAELTSRMKTKADNAGSLRLQAKNANAAADLLESRYDR